MLMIEEFLKDLRRQRLAELTVRSYRYDLQRFSRYLEEKGIHDVHRATADDIKAFLEPYRVGRRQTRYGAGLAVHVGRYFRFLQRNGLVFMSPMAPHGKGSPIEGRFPVLSHKEMTVILDSLRNDDPITARGSAMLELAYSAALRPRALRDLELPDIDRSTGILFIRQSKGHKNRGVPVGDRAVQVVDEYIGQIRPCYSLSPEQQHVFVSHSTGRPLTTKGTWWAIQETLRRSGHRRMTPYTLRVSAATALLEGGMGIGHISRILGHARIETTLRYLRVDDAELQDRIAETHPRNSWNDTLRRARS